MDRFDYPTRKTRLTAEGSDRDQYDTMTPGERFAMVDELTRTAWEFRSGRVIESRLRRDVERVVRRRG